MIGSVQICTYYFNKYIAFSAEQAGEHTAFRDTQVLSGKKSFIAIDGIVLLMWMKLLVMGFSQGDPTFDVVVLHSLRAEQIPAVLCCIFLLCSCRTTYYDGLYVEHPSALLPVQQHQDRRTTTRYILYLLSKTLRSELISFGDNPRQRFNKGQKGYVAT